MYTTRGALSPRWAHQACIMGLILIWAVSQALQPAKAADSYHIVKKIPAASLYWDYGSLDPKLERFYVGRMGGVLALDLRTDRVVEPLLKGNLIHAVIPIPGGSLLAAADGMADELKVFDTATNTAVTAVHVGGHPDALAYDPKTHLVVTINKGTHDATLVSAATWAVVGTIPLPGDPEFAVSNGQGTLYVNISDKSRIAAINLADQKVERSMKLRACQDPSGIAFDAANNLIISVCSTVAKFIAADGLKEVASIPVGKGADAVIWDPTRRRALIPAGDDGVLDIIAIRSPTDIAFLSKVATEVGARSGAVDPGSGFVYLASGKTIHEGQGGGAGWHPPSVVKGSFHILVLAPGT